MYRLIIVYCAFMCNTRGMNSVIFNKKDLCELQHRQFYFSFLLDYKFFFQ